jgi:hypothetical protein
MWRNCALAGSMVVTFIPWEEVGRPIPRGFSDKPTEGLGYRFCTSAGEPLSAFLIYSFIVACPYSFCIEFPLTRVGAILFTHDRYEASVRQRRGSLIAFAVIRG